MFTLFGIINGIDFSFYSPIHRIWQFTMGGLVYLIGGNQVNMKSKNNISRITLVSVLFFIMSGAIQKYNSHYNSIIITFLTCFIIQQKSLIFIPTYLHKFFKYFGDRSYSIYLYHVPLLFIAQNSPIFYFENRELRWILKCLFILLTIILGSISYNKVEKKFKSNYYIARKVTFKEAFSFFVLPLVLLFSMFFGSKYKYWEVFEPNYYKPPYAGDVLSDCREEQYLGTVCRLPNSSEYNENILRKIVLVGDSHAGHLSLAIREVAKRKNWQYIYLVDSPLGDFVESNELMVEKLHDKHFGSLNSRLNKLNLKKQT